MARVSGTVGLVDRINDILIDPPTSRPAVVSLWVNAIVGLGGIYSYKEMKCTVKFSVDSYERRRLLDTLRVHWATGTYLYVPYGALVHNALIISMDLNVDAKGTLEVAVEFEILKPATHLPVTHESW